MAQYTEEFLATARHGYENTDQPMRELSRELGIGITTLSTLAEKHGWAKRSLRKRGVPPAMQLLAEAQALAATLPPRSGGEGRRAPNGASRGGGQALDREAAPPPPPPPPPPDPPGGGGASAAPRPGGGGGGPPPRLIVKRPPPPTPPHHSLRSRREGSRSRPSPRRC
jgi:hypothetical protein